MMFFMLLVFHVFLNVHFKVFFVFLELIMNSLTEILKDSVQAYEITQKIINSRPITEKVSLKKEKTEKKKNKFNKNNDI